MEAITFWSRSSSAWLPPLLLAACTTAGDDQSGSRTVVFTCDSGSDVTIEFAGSVARIVSANGRDVVMEQRAAASGFRYESATHSIRGKGDDLTYSIGRMAPSQCKAVR